MEIIMENGYRTKVGVITYHSAYNFGSVLQALATQEAIKRLGYEADIINYRMKRQKQYYQQLYRTALGSKTFNKDHIMMPVRGKRLQRAKAYEQFIESRLNLTKEFEVPEAAMQVFAEYPCIVSGSDQIWNFHSNELEGQAIDYMKPYLLSDFNGKKVSYASSISNMSDVELDSIIGYISQFDHLSFREASSNKRINEKYKLGSINVPDPTFLLSRKDWIDLLDLKQSKDERYILYYSLRSYKPQRERIALLKQISERTGYKIKVVTPFVYLNYPDDYFEIHPEFGPLEFISNIINAEMIITDSYHGTILSVNFEKNFFSMCENTGSEFRKTDILCQLGLENRIIADIEESFTKLDSAIDYTQVRLKVEALRTIGYDYLKNALSSD